jgi:hypothetical protein
MRGFFHITKRDEITQICLVVRVELVEDSKHLPINFVHDGQLIVYLVRYQKNIWG